MMPPGIESLSEIPGRWWVAHTKSRFEKAFARDLESRSIGYFLPMVERVTFSGGRKRHGMMPLFPSYVFCCGDEQDRYNALTTGRLCQMIEVPQQESLLQQLEQIRLAISAGDSIDPYPFAAVGQRCRIIAGAFQGLEGVVVHRNKMARLVLEVSILGQGASIEVDADLLESID